MARGRLQMAKICCRKGPTPQKTSRPCAVSMAAVVPQVQEPLADGLDGGRVQDGPAGEADHGHILHLGHLHKGLGCVAGHRASSLVFQPVAATGPVACSAQAGKTLLAATETE